MVTFTGPRTRARLSQIVFAWWYGKESLRRYKPLVRAEFAEGDMASEARLLSIAGYHAGAAATAQSMLEKKLYKAASLAYVGDKTLKSKTAEQLSLMLTKRGVWSIEDHKRLNKNINKLVGFIRHNPTERRLLFDAIHHSEVLAEKLDSLILYAIESRG